MQAGRAEDPLRRECSGEGEGLEEIEAENLPVLCSF
jgi:hypothetical protein